jgi:hypothetical protein
VQTNVVIPSPWPDAGAAGRCGGGLRRARPEYLLVPLVPSSARRWSLVGTNIAAGSAEAARFDCVIGGAIAFAITEAIGIATAVWPQAWLTLFSMQPHVIETGSTYLRAVGPFYGFFGLALALYFAS